MDSSKPMTISPSHPQKMSYFFPEKPSARWLISLLILIPLLGQYCFNELLDIKFSLCSVRCRHSYGESVIPSLDSQIYGNRPLFQSDQCDCYRRIPRNSSTSSSFSSLYSLIPSSLNTYRFLGSISWHETRPPPSNSVTAHVCAADGQSYPSQHSACLNDTFPLHGGHCGACSNEADINVYRKTNQTMSVLAYQCMVKYLLFGTEEDALACFQTSGLSNNCNQCWIDNMKCSASSCLMKCVWHNVLQKVPWSDQNQKLNPCIQCDEELCGPAFVTCAGANRRRAGIVSDISRPTVDVWNRTAC